MVSKIHSYIKYSYIYLIFPVYIEGANYAACSLVKHEGAVNISVAIPHSLPIHTPDAESKKQSLKFIGRDIISYSVAR